jgi:hypothetical protein
VNKVGLVTAAGREPPRESTPKLPDAPSKVEPKPEPPAAAVAPAPAAAPAEPVKLEPLRPTDKPPAIDDAGSWSAVPPPPVPDPGLALDDGINVVVEEEVLIADRGGPPTAPRILAANPVDEEDTEVKAIARRSERPARGGPTRR